MTKLRRLLRMAFACLLVVFPVMVAAPATAASSTLYNLFTDAAYESVGGTTVVAQSFTTSVSPATLTSVRLWLRNESGSLGNYTARITDSSAGQPGTTLATLASNTATAPYEEAQPVLSGSALSLAPSTQYFILVSGSSGIIWKGGISFPTTSVSPVPSFPSYRSSDSGSTWAALSGTYRDMVVIVDEQPVAPAAPTLNSVTAGNGTLTVSATLGATGGSTITDVEYSTDNGSNWTSSGQATGSFTISGLSNGIAYPVRVRAVNAVAPGTASGSITATPRTVPGAPTSVSASPGDGTASLTWSVPITDGGSAITTYTVTSSPGSLQCATSTTSCTVSGLGNGTAYTFTVVATNAAGNSNPSASSSAVTPRAPVPPPPPDPDPTSIPTPQATSTAEPTRIPTVEPTATPTPTSTKSPRPTPSPSVRPTTQVDGGVTEGAVSPPFDERPVEEQITEDIASTEETPSPNESPSASPSGTPASSDLTNGGGSAQATFDARPPPGQSLLTDTALVGPVMNLRVDLQLGASVTGRSAVVEAAGLLPNSVVQVLLYSEPQIIGEGIADAAGNAAIATSIPDSLPAGQHTIMAVGTDSSGSPVQSVGAFEITTDEIVTNFIEPAQLSEPIDPEDPQIARALSAQKPLFDVALFPAVIATVALAGAAFIGLAGPGGLVSNASGESRSSRGKLAGIVTKKLKALSASDSKWGDRSQSWAMPGTRRTDEWIKELSVKAGKFSALIPRILVDGAWSRAMFGSFGFLLWGAGLALGLISAWTTGFETLPPALPLMLAIIALGILDAAAGAVAWLTIVLAALVMGNLTTWPEIRTALGLFVIFASIPLLAHVIRPLRRRVGDSLMDRFDRVADYVMPPVFLAFAASSMFKALNGLSGLELVSSDDFAEVRLVVIGAFLVRMAMEDFATYAYPVRTAEVQPNKLTSPSRNLALFSVAIRIGVFLIIAVPFFGLGWATYLSAAFVSIPLVLKVYEDDLPNWPWLNKWYPRGVAQFVMLLIIGIYISFWLLGQDATDEQVRQTYNFILLPGIISGLITLVGREGGVWPENWWKRILGFAVWLFAVLIVTGAVALG